MAARTDITRKEEGRIEYANGGGFVLPRVSQKISHSDLDAAATTQAISISNFPANAIPVCAHIELDTAFSGGSATSVAVEVGDAGDVDELVTSTSVFTGVAAGVKSAAGVAVGKFNHESAYSPQAKFTSDVNVADLTAGALWVHISYVLAPQKT